MCSLARAVFQVKTRSQWSSRSTNRVTQAMKSKTTIKTTNLQVHPDTSHFVQQQRRSEDSRSLQGEDDGREMLSKLDRQRRSGGILREEDAWCRSWSHSCAMTHWSVSSR